MTEEKKTKTTKTSTAAKKPAKKTAKKAEAEAKEEKKVDPAKAAAKKAKKAKREAGSGSKRFRSVKKLVDVNKAYKLEEALSLVKKGATAKFDETIDITLNLGIDASNTDQTVRGVIAMPNGLGKSVKVAVFAKGAKATEAEKAGADIVGAEEFAAKVEKGEVNFDRCIATPDMMAVVGRLGKVLGPKGLMPNPKLGTVTMDVAAAVKAAKSGQVEFRAEKAGIVHAGVGKASFNEKALQENIKAFVKAVNQAKPADTKGIYIKSAYISSTMGPSVKVDTTSFAA